VIERFYSEPPVGLGLKPSKLTPKGKPSTDDEAMTSVNHPEAGLLLEFRGLNKAVSTWFKGLPDKADQGGYIHPDFRQHGTLTHRLSCAEPNSQQFPREGPVKSMFIPEEGCELVEFDYRAIEFRLAAWYSGDENLINVFKTNGDIHQFVADRLGISRQPAKNTNFTIIYAGGPSRIAATAGIPLKAARIIYNDYRAEYPKLFAIADRCEELAEARGYIKYWDGRRRVFKQTFECRKAFNSIVQGGAFQIIKRSMLELEAMNVDMVNQVHDSIWVNMEIGADKQPIISAMVDWTVERFKMPFDVEWKILNGKVIA
jgi:DNA polymerase-1